MLKYRSGQSYSSAASKKYPIDAKRAHEVYSSAVSKLHYDDEKMELTVAWWGNEDRDYVYENVKVHEFLSLVSAPSVGAAVSAFVQRRKEAQKEQERREKAAEIAIDALLRRYSSPTIDAIYKKLRDRRGSA